MLGMLHVSLWLPCLGGAKEKKIPAMVGISVGQ